MLPEPASQDEFATLTTADNEEAAEMSALTAPEQEFEPPDKSPPSPIVPPSVDSSPSSQLPPMTAAKNQLSSFLSTLQFPTQAAAFPEHAQSYLKTYAAYYQECKAILKAESSSE